MMIPNGVDKMREIAGSVERELALTLEAVRGPVPESPSSCLPSTDTVIGKFENLIATLVRIQTYSEELGHLFIDRGESVGYGQQDLQAARDVLAKSKALEDHVKSGFGRSLR